VGAGFFIPMNNIPVPLRGALITNILDESGRIVVPNAIFAFEQKLRLIGIGSIPTETTITKFMPLPDGSKIGTIYGVPYLMQSFPAVLKTRSNFVTDLEYIQDGETTHVVPYKRLGLNEGLEEVHKLVIPDAELILIAPYSTQVSSGTGGSIFFFLKKGLQMARIPMPNTYADGKFCIGTGVEFDSLPRPSELLDKVYQCLMNDRYNADLWDDLYSRHKWVPQDGEFVLTVPFDSCYSIINEQLTSVLS
jgi:hypothetical protein